MATKIDFTRQFHAAGFFIAWFVVLLLSNPQPAVAQDSAPPEGASSGQAAAAESDQAGDSVEHSSELEADLEKQLKDNGLPALWVLKYSADGSIKQASAGIRKMGEPTPVQEGDLIHLGSCTKAMTAVLIAQLVAEGRLRFETTLQEVFPELDELAESDWAAVSVQELLRQRSGAPANTDWHGFDRKFPDDNRRARREIVTWLAGQTRPKTPTYVYSNVGFAVLGHIVETIEDDQWQTIVRRKLFQPLGIQSAGFGPVAGNQPLEQPWGHTGPAGAEALGQSIAAFFGGSKPSYRPIQLDNAPPLGPAGRVHMTMVDWSRFVRLFATQSAPERLAIDLDTWKQMLSTGEQGNYGGGWLHHQRGWADGLALSHDGSNTTWYCVVWIAPKKGFFTLVATNCFDKRAIATCDRISGKLLTE